MASFTDLCGRLAAAARALLRWASGCVAPAHREWIDGMRAEFDEIEPRFSRLGWALGGLRVIWVDRRRPLMRDKRPAVTLLALMILIVVPFQRVHVLMPLAVCAVLVLRRMHSSTQPSGPPVRTLQAAVLAGVATCLALAVYGVTHYPIGSGSPSLSTVIFAGILASYVGVALVWPGSPATAASALRYGLLGGIGTGCLSLLGSIPLMPIGAGWITMVVGIYAPIAIGMWAAASSGHARAGLDAGLWSGMIGALTFFVGLVSLTYAVTGWFTHDPATIADFQKSWSPQHIQEYRNHYHSITTFLVSDNLGHASVRLGVFPVLSTVFGALGGAPGAGHRPPANGKGESPDFTNG